MNNAIALVIVFGIIAFFLSLLIFTGLFLYKRWKKNRIYINIISDGGYKERFSRHQEDINETVSYQGESYIFRNECVITTPKDKEIYYLKGKCEPLRISSQGIKIIQDSNGNKINAKNLKSIIETELIAKLFKKEILNTENILLFINIIMVGIAIFLLFLIKSKGVHLIDDETNINLIKNAVTSAIRG